MLVSSGAVVFNLPHSAEVQLITFVCSKFQFSISYTARTGDLLNVSSVESESCSAGRTTP